MNIKAQYLIRTSRETLGFCTKSVEMSQVKVVFLQESSDLGSRINKPFQIKLKK